MSRRAPSSVRAAFVVVLALAASARAQSVEWPLQLDAEGGRVVAYQPQVESYRGDRLESRAAVSVTPTGSDAPVFGAVWFSARMVTDMETRTVTCDEIDVTSAKFPDAAQEHVDALSRFLESEIPRWEIVLSLDDLLAATEAAGGHAPRDAFNNDPPEIIVRPGAAVLVLLDGEPKLAALEGYELQYVINTPFFIVRDEASARYYLKGGAHWFSATDVMGPWRVTSDLPAEVREVARRVEEEEKKQAEADAAAGVDGGEPTAEDKAAAKAVPDVIVRTAPAELIVTDGDPDFAPIEGTNLLYLRNTESDVIMDITSQQYYLLLSGRWFTSKSFASGASWTFIAHDALPADFAAIPEASDMGNVLASVAGTQESREAVLENTIPQTAVVDRKTATVEVRYDGDPTFEECAENGVLYATNTDKSVLLIDGKYYCCDDAVWFVADGPEGPWAVCDRIPDEVQDLPPDCPVYNVKYVYVYESTPEVVYVGYTPAYTGAYIWGGCVVWGTGWSYHPWYHAYYYPRPVTYGFHAHYNPWTGWGFSVGVSHGWVHVGVGWGRPPYYGWWGPAGYHHGYRHGYYHGYRHGYAHGYRHGAAAGYARGYRAGQTRASPNVYKNRASGVRSTGRGGAAARPSTANVKRRPTSAKQPNNVYADRNGNVYRKQGDSVQRKDKSGWSQADRQSRERVQRDADTRQRSQQRQQSYQKNRSQQKPQQKPQQRSRSGGKRRG
jgi:hypothetical protein